MMKILYFGTVCGLNTYEKMLSKCKQKPTVATIVFDSALLTGFRQHGLEADILSCPMIPVFPRCSHIAWGNKKEQLPCGYDVTWVKTVNLPFVKQWSRSLDVKVKINRWIKSNKWQDCAVLVYGINAFVSPVVVEQCKKAGVKCYAVVPDLPEHMYINSHSRGIEKWAEERFIKKAVDVQSRFDGYVYLTEAMKDVISPKKPFVIVEGIADTSLAKFYDARNRSAARGIMYAGGLQRKFGIIHLLDAFEEADIDNAELWLFGEGDAVEDITARSLKNPSIRYFGRVSRDKVLEYEHQAVLLVNVRSVSEDFTKYSFPSKTIEYMLSGTPLLSTRLQGIPEEYFDYMYSTDDNDVSSLSNKLKEIMNLPAETLAEKGTEAQKFVVENKGSVAQTQKIIDGLNLK